MTCDGSSGNRRKRTSEPRRPGGLTRWIALSEESILDFLSRSRVRWPLCMFEMCRTRSGLESHCHPPVAIPVLELHKRFSCSDSHSTECPAQYDCLRRAGEAFALTSRAEALAEFRETRIPGCLFEKRTDGASLR